MGVPIKFGSNIVDSPAQNNYDYDVEFTQYPDRC